MLAIAAVIAVGTLGELVLAEHVGDPVQAVPFALVVLGLVAIVAAWVAPGRRSVLALRSAAVVLVLGGGFGVWEHLEHNLLFEAEIRPTASAGTRLWEAVFGASPLLAPGIVAVIGLLAGASTVEARP